MEAQPSRNISGVRPSPNTPSDVSCSSGPCSAVSTRETSPASSTQYLLETSAARDSLISCPDDIIAIPSVGPDQFRPCHYSCRPRPGLETTIASPLEMNPNPFQPVSGGRHSNKLAAEDHHVSHPSSGATPDDANLCHRLSNHQFRHILVPSPSQHPSSIPPASASIPRGLRTPNWRSSTVSLDSLTSPSPISNNLTDPSSTCLPRDTPTRDFPIASSPRFLRQGVSNFDPRSNHSPFAHPPYVPIAGFSSSNPSSSTQYRDKHPFETQPFPVNNVAAKMKPQSGKIIADSAMDRTMAYCYDRGGGEFTRLIPVDMLPVELENIPRRVPTDAEMIVLPIPRQPGADGQPADANMEQQRVVAPTSIPNGNGVASTDIIQSQIDSIVASSPGPGAGPLVLATRGFDGNTPTRTNATSSAGGGSSGRREKVYCDKWIHDGTCAFTQQGCKYKHEMPHDRETQEKLGLFHGYPTWWKKAALEAQRPLAIDDRPVNLNTGRPALPAIAASTSVGTGMSNAVVSNNWRAGPGPMLGDAGGVQRSPSSPTPLGNGGMRSIGFGSAGRGTGRQVRTFGESPPPSSNISLPQTGREGSHLFQDGLVFEAPQQQENKSLTQHATASFTPPTYGPIAPPSRAAGATSGFGSASYATAAAANPAGPTTRNTRSMTMSSMVSNHETGGGGAPFGAVPQQQQQQQQRRSAFESGNPFAPLGELVQQSSPADSPVMTRREDPDSSSGDNTAADGEQRGAPL